MAKKDDKEKEKRPRSSTSPAREACRRLISLVEALTNKERKPAPVKFTKDEQTLVDEGTALANEAYSSLSGSRAGMSIDELKAEVKKASDRIGKGDMTAAADLSRYSRRLAAALKEDEPATE